MEIDIVRYDFENQQQSVMINIQIEQQLSPRHSTVINDAKLSSVKEYVQDRVENVAERPLFPMQMKIMQRSSVYDLTDSRTLE